MAQLNEYIAQRNPPIKLHLGCGGMRWKDFINVDKHPAEENEHDSSRNGCVADVFADMTDLGLAPDSVDEIFTSHTIDHFTRWVAIKMFTDWHRIIKPGGRLVIEVADFWRCVRWLFHPRKKYRRLGRSQFYGNQHDEIEYQTHRYVWGAAELEKLLLEIGFAKVRISHRTKTHYPGRDMRVEATK